MLICQTHFFLELERLRQVEIGTGFTSAHSYARVYPNVSDHRHGHKSHQEQPQFSSSSSSSLLFRVLKKRKTFFCHFFSYTYSLSTTLLPTREKKVLFPTLFSVIVSRVKFFPSHWVCSKFTFFGCEKAVNCTSVKIVSCCCVLSWNESIKVLKMCI